MKRAEADLEDRPSGEFLRRPKVPHFVFHTHQTRPFPVDPSLLSKEERRPVQEILQYVDKLDKSVNQSMVDKIALGRMGAFIDNYVKMTLECRKDYSPVVLACGSFGALNAFFAAGAIDIKKGVLPVMRAQAEAMVKANQICAGGSFLVQISSQADQQTRERILEMQELREQGFYVSDERQGLMYVGASDGHPDDNLDYLRQVNPKMGWSILTGEAPLGTRLMEPHLGRLQKVLDTVNFKQPKIPIIGGDGYPIESTSAMQEAIIREMVAPSDLDAIERILAERWDIRELHHLGLDRVENDNHRLGISAIAVGVGLVTATVLSVFVIKGVHRYRRSKKV